MKLRAFCCVFALCLTGQTVVAGESPRPSFVDQGIDARNPLYERITYLEEQETLGLRYYSSGNFERAYTVLSEPASEGFKDSQQAMALMYLKGDGVEQHQLKGAALLGLVAENGDKKITRQYNKMLKAFPENVRKLVEQQTAYYKQRYGMQAQGITCVRNKQAFSHFSDIDCVKKPGEFTVYAWNP